MIQTHRKHNADSTVKVEGQHARLEDKENWTHHQFIIHPHLQSGRTGLPLVWSGLVWFGLVWSLSVFGHILVVLTPL